MSTRIETYFSEADRDAIREATAEAERRTAGELVVYVTERCDDYPEALWKAALAGGALGALCAAITVELFGGWGTPDYLWILVGLELGLIGGWLCSRVEPVRRWLVREETLTSRAEARAAEAFIEEQVFATKERTGALIFLALFEHRVLVLADAGIHERVDSNAWDQITAELASEIRGGAPARALIHAVGRCADLLAAHGVTPSDAENELPDEPRFRND